MSKALTSEEQANDIVEDADARLKNIDTLPFSPPAFVTLKGKVAQYVRDLINESVKVSKRHQADTVSAAHVDRASEYLVSSTFKRLYRHLGTVGGILLGAALSNILAMTLAAQYTGAGTIVSAVSGIAGSFMIALSIAKD